MAITAAQLVANISVTNAASSAAQIASVGAAAQISSAQLAHMALAGVAVAGAALIGVGIASVKMAADYQQSMDKVQALTGTSAAQMTQYDGALKTLAVNAGVAPKALADGLYNVISAGYSGVGAMTMLTLATQDSKIGMTDAATATNALTNVMANFKSKVADANIVNGEMLQTVTLGKATFADYANNITKAASTSAQYGENMQTMNAAWATLTASGIRAGMATTDYDQSLKVMDGNIGKVSVSLNKNGIAFNESAFNAMDYGHKVVYLNAALQEARDKHVAITGATIQAAQAIKTISDHIGMYNNDLSLLSNRAAMAAKTQQAWAITQSGFNQQMSQAGAAVQVLMINIGAKLLPALTQLAGAVTPIITRFTEWISTGDRLNQFLNDSSPKMDLLKIAVIALAGAIGGIATFAMYTFAVAAWAALVPLLPWIAIGALVALAIAGIVLVITHWGQIMQWAGGIFEWLGTHAREIATGIKNAVGGAFDALGTQMRESATKIKNDVGGKFDDLGTQMRESATKTKNDVGNIFSGLGSAAHNAGASIVDAGKWMYDHNTYWKQSADDIGAAFSGLGKGMHATGDAIRIDMGKEFNDMGTQMRQSSTKTGNDVGNIFSTMGTHVSQAVATMRANSGAGFSSLGSQASGVMNALRVNVLDNIGRAVGGFMSQMGSLVSGAAGELGQLTGEFFSALGGLASQAFAWGANIIGNLISGIASKLGDLAGVVGQAAGKLASILGFHSPAKEGPGADADKWMPNLIRMLSEGLIAGTPQMRSAALQVATTLQPLIQANLHMSPGGAIPSPVGITGGQTPVIVNITVQSADVNLDGQRLTNTLMPRIVQTIRQNTGTRY